MKKYFMFLVILIWPVAIVSAAEPIEKACKSAEYNHLDFWLGSWELTWQGGEGTNVITKTYGDCVIHENFQSPTFQGMSISMFDKLTGQWRQNWMDDQGSYFDFYGFKEGDDFIFQTMPDPKKPEIIQRMIFTDIKENSLTWLWQKTADGGASWQEMWKINYSRK